MSQFISKFLKKSSSFLKKNKRLLFSITTLALFLVLIPTKTVHAGLFSWVGDMIDMLINLPLNIVLLLIIASATIPLSIIGIGSVLLFIGVAWLAYGLLYYSMSMAVSPASADVIEPVLTGWTFARDFVNMFFAITLTFIGLSTILKIKDYEAKKALPKLIQIAILVNFTPVIIGFFVDAGNLVTKFFVEQAGVVNMTEVVDILNDFVGIDQISNFIENVGSSLTGNFTSTLVSGLNLVIRINVGIIFGVFAAYIYLCMASIFLLRIVMLWLLTIVSPIAFFSYIFPKESQLRRLFPGILSWDEWWDKFIQWVIVGIPFGLFLYISTAIFKKAGNIELIGVSGFDADTLGQTGFAGVDLTEIFITINDLFGFAIALAILWKGYKISVKAAPEMAQAAVSATKKYTQKYGKAAGRIARKGADRTVGRVGRAAARKGGQAMGRAADKLEQKGKKPGMMSRALRRGETTLTQAGKREEPELPGNWEDMSLDEKVNAQKGLKGRQKMKALSSFSSSELSKIPEEEKGKLTPAMEEMAEKKKYRKQYGDTFKKMKKGGITSAALEKSLSDDPEKTEQEIGNKVNDIKEKAKHDKELQDEIDLKAQTSRKSKEEVLQDIAAQALNVKNVSSPEDLDSDTITSLGFRLGSEQLGGWDLNKIRRRKDGQEVHNQLMNGAGGINSRFGKEAINEEGEKDAEYGLNELMDKNKDLASYLLTNKNGRYLGYDQLENEDESIRHDDGKIDMKKVKQKYKKYAMRKDADPSKVEMPIGVSPLDDVIREMRNKMEEKRVNNSDNPEYKYNGAYVNKLLRMEGKEPGTTGAGAWLKKNLDKAEAKRRYAEKVNKQMNELKKLKAKAENLNDLSKLQGLERSIEKAREEIKKRQEGIRKTEEEIGEDNPIYESTIKDHKKKLKKAKKKLHNTIEELEDFELS